MGAFPLRLCAAFLGVLVASAEVVEVDLETVETARGYSPYGHSRLLDVTGPVQIVVTNPTPGQAYGLSSGATNLNEANGYTWSDLGRKACFTTAVVPPAPAQEDFEATTAATFRVYHGSTLIWSENVSWHVTATLDVIEGGPLDAYQLAAELLTIYVNAQTGEATYEQIGPEIPINDSAGVVILDNRLPGNVDIEFGDELLELEPGYNVFPFNGDLDENDEFPQAMVDSDIPATRVVGDDGVPYWIARISPVPESQFGAWEEGPLMPFDWLPPSTSGAGPVVKVPGMITDTSDYVQIPNGVLPGNNVPLPGGMEPGSSSELPSGVTPGTDGALPDGVISGGYDYLPPGVSQGTTPLDPPTSGGGGGGGATSGGATGSTAGAVTEDTTGEAGYLPGPDMSQMADEAKAQGAAWAESAAQGFGEGMESLSGKGKTVFGEGGFKFWEGDSPIGGSDESWLNFTLPIGDVTAQIEVPDNIIGLIRAILLWGVKIWFVVSIIKLFMR